MSTNPTIFGRTTGFQACPRLAGVDDALAVFTRNLSTVMLDGRSSTSSMFNARRLDATRPLGVAVAPQGLAAVLSRVTPRPDVALAPTAVLEQLQAASGLTLEELADLLGTSRRSLHNWKNGGALNATNDRRLRDVAHAVVGMQSLGGASARDALLTRHDGGVRPIDLLTEGRYDAAVSLATGRYQYAGNASGGLTPTLAARFDPVGPIEPVGKVRVLIRPTRRKQS